ncbi:hypothetical protein D9M72_396130 [compost metagenome]
MASVALFTGNTLPMSILGPANAVTAVGSFSRARGNFTAAAGIQVALEVAPTVAQAGTAGFTALDVNPAITTNGSGNTLLQRWAVGGTTWGAFRTNGNIVTRGTICAGSVDGLTGATSFLSVLGSLSVAPTIITTSTTLGITHGTVLANPGFGTEMILTLPAANTCVGRIYHITRISGAFADCIVQANGVELIGPSNTYSLGQLNTSVTLQSGAGGWRVLAAVEAPSTDRGVPVVNLMSDSGKGSARASPINRTVGAYDAGKYSIWFGAYNGASAWTEAGKYIFDNSTNGGAAGALTPTVVDLLNKQGRTTPALARYGVEYFVLERTAGVGVTNPHSANWPNNSLTSTCSFGMFGADNATTFIGWVRCIDGNQLVIGAGLVWIDGKRTTDQTGSAVITPAMGWVHIRATTRTSIGYDNAWPRLYAEVGQKFQVALCGFFNGEVNPGIHTAPLQTINELLP